MLLPGRNVHTSPTAMTRLLLLKFLLSAAFSAHLVATEIASAAGDSTGVQANSLARRVFSTDSGGSVCSVRKFQAMAKAIDDVEDLELDVPVNIAFDSHQKKRKRAKHRCTPSSSALIQCFARPKTMSNECPGMAASMPVQAF
ncbi:unnamed protein product [Ceratitis capitata]|uniref:(Mediterranean fruit fly) hypothetical protein n=1 Tax=Ceratitis capitata TaxID=7213 RepID=A0A811V7X5_CERCA|nr:unnamed protein product [Ceratitis capitata]